MFRASKWRRLSEFWLVLLFAVLTGVAIWQWIGGKGTAYQNLMALIWPAMLGLSATIVTRLVHTVEFNQGGICLKRLLGSVSLQDDQVAAVNLSPATGSATIIDSHAKEYPIFLNTFVQGRALAERLESRYGHLVAKRAQQALDSGHIYREKTASRVLLGLSVFCTVLFGAAYLGDPTTLPLVIFGLSIELVLVWVGVASLKNFTQVSRQGITSRHFGAPKTIEWHDVRSVVLATRAKVNQEIMTIKGSKDEVTISIGEDTSLREAILLSVPKEKVEDTRASLS